VLLKSLAAIFGCPGEIAREGCLDRAAALALRAWLGALEAMARALLVSLAAALPRCEPSLRPARRGSVAPRRVVHAADPRHEKRAARGTTRRSRTTASTPSAGSA
jgi:hypothetical protein